MASKKDRKNLIEHALLESVQEAQAAGVVSPILGASVKALRCLLDGKQSMSPILTFRVKVLPPGASQPVVVEYPLFCDPGLRGLSVYAIERPTAAAKEGVAS